MEPKATKYTWSKKVPLKLRQEIVDRVRNGLSYSKAGKIYGLSHTTIMHYVACDGGLDTPRGQKCGGRPNKSVQEYFDRNRIKESKPKTRQNYIKKPVYLKKPEIEHQKGRGKNYKELLKEAKRKNPELY